VNLVVGIVGGVLGGWRCGLIGISSSSIIGSLITSVVGAIVLLWLVGLISRSMRR
ncbi:MAG: GlsB/YeaQ/YmgE family stress response membrane protein, partial [Muribaculaceae bacterium]|nr:GlsB/YeaQ/YmgE family stress response membrane protein [Muribaculaceae bacterium]